MVCRLRFSVRLARIAPCMKTPVALCVSGVLKVVFCGRRFSGRQPLALTICVVWLLHQAVGVSSGKLEMPCNVNCAQRVPSALWTA